MVKTTKFDSNPYYVGINSGTLGFLQEVKKELNNDSRLTLPEVLTALSICSATNAMTEKALLCLKKLENAEAHATYIVHNGDKKTLKGLKINLTCESEYLRNEDIDFM